MGNCCLKKSSVVEPPQSFSKNRNPYKKIQEVEDVNLPEKKPKLSELISKYEKISSAAPMNQSYQGGGQSLLETIHETGLSNSVEYHSNKIPQLNRPTDFTNSLVVDAPLRVELNNSTVCDQASKLLHHAYHADEDTVSSNDLRSDESLSILTSSVSEDDSSLLSPPTVPSSTGENNTTRRTPKKRIVHSATSPITSHAVSSDGIPSPQSTPPKHPITSPQISPRMHDRLSALKLRLTKVTSDLDHHIPHCVSVDTYLMPDSDVRREEEGEKVENDRSDSIDFTGSDSSSNNNLNTAFNTKTNSYTKLNTPPHKTKSCSDVITGFESDSFNVKNESPVKPSLKKGFMTNNDSFLVNEFNKEYNSLDIISGASGVVINPAAVTTPKGNMSSPKSASNYYILENGQLKFMDHKTKTYKIVSLSDVTIAVRDNVIDILSQPQPDTETPQNNANDNNNVSVKPFDGNNSNSNNKEEQSDSTKTNCTTQDSNEGDSFYSYSLATTVNDLSENNIRTLQNPHTKPNLQLESLSGSNDRNSSFISHPDSLTPTSTKSNMTHESLDFSFKSVYTSDKHAPVTADRNTTGTRLSLRLKSNQEANDWKEALIEHVKFATSNNNNNNNNNNTQHCRTQHNSV